MRIFAEKNEKFLFVFDEWDAVFHMPFVTENDKKAYLLFLKGLLKDKPYVALTYMTGILPIAKFSSGSELNMFIEYTMGSEPKFSEDFGFTETEVDMLYKRYLDNCKREGKPVSVTREEILSAMVVYGFLSCYKGRVYIPNKELMDKFDEMLQVSY